MILKWAILHIEYFYYWTVYFDANTFTLVHSLMQDLYLYTVVWLLSLKYKI